MADAKKEPLVSIIILNYNGLDVIKDCLDSVLATTYSNFEVIIVDNASTDKSLFFIKRNYYGDNRIKILENEKNLFYAEGNNKGVKLANGEYIVFLNNDTVVDKYWIRNIVLAMGDNEIGAAQPKIMKYNNKMIIDNVGGCINRFGFTAGKGSGQVDRGQYDDGGEIFFAGGTAMVVKKHVLNEVGIFDSRFVAHWEDVDLSWRIRLKGYKIILIPNAVVYHKISQTIKNYGDKAALMFHIRKNRLAGVLKNYNFLNLTVVLPSLVALYCLILMKDLFFDRSFKGSLMSILAIIWNIKEFPRTLQQRKLIQNDMRCVLDRDIIKIMNNHYFNI